MLGKFSLPTLWKFLVASYLNVATAFRVLAAGCYVISSWNCKHIASMGLEVQLSRNSGVILFGNLHVNHVICFSKLALAACDAGV